jgi:hypothetical protein
VTDLDIQLARAVSAVAAQAGAALDSSPVSRLELGLDTPDHESIAPFWAAVLATGQPSGTGVDDEVRDPADALPTVWFQASGSEEPRQRWHLDLWGTPGSGPAADSGGPRGRRHPGQRRGGAELLGASRPAGQPGLPVHLAGPGRSPQVGTCASCLSAVL